MLTRRIIACLDVDAGRVVKGTKFLNLRDAGDPSELARAHAESGADEIVLLDISATHEKRAILIDTVKRAARDLFIPFTVGGGVRTLEDAAFTEGCSQIGAFLRIALPLVAPGLVASTLFCVMFSWNDFLYPAFLTTASTKPLSGLGCGSQTPTVMKPGSPNISLGR